MKKIINFISIEAPERCGVHPSFGKVAKDIFFEELKGVNEYAHEEFPSSRERAKLGLPYKPAEGKEEEYEKCLDFLELCIICHRMKEHNDFEEEERYDTLTASLSTEEVELAASDYWVA